MNKPDKSKYTSDANYQFALAGYWQDRFNCARDVAEDCLFRLSELEEITCENGVWFWQASGEQVGGV